MVFYADILVPLDNYISRSTEHFLTCKDPDYQESLFKMISLVRLVSKISLSVNVFSNTMQVTHTNLIKVPVILSTLLISC
jgi:hypothetical protein